MGDLSDMGKGIMGALTMLLVVAAIAVPLALWKLWELGVWLFSHVHFSW